MIGLVAVQSHELCSTSLFVFIVGGELRLVFVGHDEMDLDVDVFGGLLDGSSLALRECA